MPDFDTLLPGFPGLVRWAERIGAAVWIRDPEGKICHLNSRAEALFGVSRAEWEGKRCHDLIASHGSSGEPFCGPDCAVVRQTRAQIEIESVEISVRNYHDGRHWVRILVLPFTASLGSDPYLLHCAVSVDREHRMREFMAKVAERAERDGKYKGSGRGTGASRPHRLAGKRLATLTAREAQVLALLAADHTLPEIAGELGLSHVTVRNHVQHVLRKLGVHSILEAVAVQLMESGGKSDVV
jgi:PAS domain S-box-containing protein